MLRYVLETARNTAQAIAILQRVPVHMSYSVTLLDKAADWATVFVGPDRPVEVTRRKAVTNYQRVIEWPEHARATRAYERLEAMERQLDNRASAQTLTETLLADPLYQNAWARGYGTLYTAVYRPLSGRIDLHWPGAVWAQSLRTFEEGHHDILYRAPSQ